jgi:hypothetical protein
MVVQDFASKVVYLDTAPLIWQCGRKQLVILGLLFLIFHCQFEGEAGNAGEQPARR